MTSVLCSFWFFYLFIHNNNNKYELKYEILVVNLGSGVQHVYNTLTPHLQHAYNTLTRFKCGYRVTGGYSYKQHKKFCSSFCTFQIHWYPLNVQNGLCFFFQFDYYYYYLILWLPLPTTHTVPWILNSTIPNIRFLSAS